jgi:hypothetical protein
LNDRPEAPGVLNAGQRTALRNLAMKKAGKDVDWITIADARALTDLGLAERNRSGWRITAKGEAVLSEAEAETPSATVLPGPGAD